MGLCKIILSNKIDIKIPTINNACKNTDAVVVLKDKNKNRRDIIHNENDPSTKKNV